MVYCRNCGALLPDDALYCPKCGAAIHIQETPIPPNSSQSQYSSPIAPGLKLASWGDRFVAWLIDVIIIGIFVGILDLVPGFNWTPLPFIPSWIPFFNISIGGIFFFLYWMIMDGNYGQSLGKMIMHIKITHLDGSPINMGAAALESFGKQFLLLLDLVLGIILYPNRQQRLFNYLSETIVIRE
jgi:uncharacterized RDD family membrane protein YckC